MMREYQTNKLHLKFDYETIERDFDIYQIKQKAEGKKYISQMLIILVYANKMMQQCLDLAASNSHIQRV